MILHNDMHKTMHNNIWKIICIILYNLLHNVLFMNTSSSCNWSTTQYIPVWTPNCDMIRRFFLFSVIVIHNVSFLRCLTLQHAKICSVFDSRSMSTYCYSLFAHIVYKSGPGGVPGSSGNPWGGGLAPAAVEIGLFSGSPVHWRARACARARERDMLGLAVWEQYRPEFCQNAQKIMVSPVK